MSDQDHKKTAIIVGKLSNGIKLLAFNSETDQAFCQVLELAASQPQLALQGLASMSQSSRRTTLPVDAARCYIMKAS